MRSLVFRARALAFLSLVLITNTKLARQKSGDEAVGRWRCAGGGNVESVDERGIAAARDVAWGALF